MYIFEGYTYPSNIFYENSSFHKTEKFILKNIFHNKKIFLKKYFFCGKHSSRKIEIFILEFFEERYFFLKQKYNFYHHKNMSQTLTFTTPGDSYSTVLTVQFPITHLLRDQYTGSKTIVCERTPRGDVEICTISLSVEKFCRVFRRGNITDVHMEMTTESLKSFEGEWEFLHGARGGCWYFTLSTPVEIGDGLAAKFPVEEWDLDHDGECVVGYFSSTEGEYSHTQYKDDEEDDY